MHETALDRRARMVWSLAAASGSHALVFILVAMALRFAGSGSALTDMSAPIELPQTLVWLQGGGGGGGGGNGQKAPARRLERQGHDRANLPGPPPALTRIDATREPDPIDRVTIPVQPLGDALVSMLGVVDMPASQALSLGSGKGPGAGIGDGGGVGPGRGNGLDAGDKDGYGGGSGPGGGTTMPIALHMEKPRYSTEAMRARIQGIVVVECIVRSDGRCSDIHVVRSLDPTFGLDEEARRAVAQWRFKPGMRRGEPLPVAVRLELEFAIR